MTEEQMEGEAQKLVDAIQREHADKIEQLKSRVEAVCREYDFPSEPVMETILQKMIAVELLQAEINQIKEFLSEGKMPPSIIPEL